MRCGKIIDEESKQRYCCSDVKMQREEMSTFYGEMQFKMIDVNDAEVLAGCCEISYRQGRS